MAWLSSEGHTWLPESSDCSSLALGPVAFIARLCRQGLPHFADEKKRAGGKSLPWRHWAMRRTWSSNSRSPILATAAPSLETARRGGRASGAQAPARRPALGVDARALLGVRAVPAGRGGAPNGFWGAGAPGGPG